MLQIKLDFQAYTSNAGYLSMTPQQAHWQRKGEVTDWLVWSARYSIGRLVPVEVLVCVMRIRSTVYGVCVVSPRYSEDQTYSTIFLFSATAPLNSLCSDSNMGKKAPCMKMNQLAMVSGLLRLPWQVLEPRFCSCTSVCVLSHLWIYQVLLTPSRFPQYMYIYVWMYIYCMRGMRSGPTHAGSLLGSPPK